MEKKLQKSFLTDYNLLTAQDLWQKLYSLKYARYYWCRLCNRFWNAILGEYHDLYIQSDTLLLADVFENFRNMCFKIYEFDPIRFLNEPSLVWQENTF